MLKVEGSFSGFGRPNHFGIVSLSKFRYSG